LLVRDSMATGGRVHVQPRFGGNASSGRAGRAACVPL